MGIFWASVLPPETRWTDEPLGLYQSSKRETPTPARIENSRRISLVNSVCQIEYIYIYIYIVIHDDDIEAARHPRGTLV